MKYPENIMRIVRWSLDLEFDDISRDREIEAMSKQEIFSRVCDWEGLIDYDSTIKSWIKQIYGIDLNKEE